MLMPLRLNVDDDEFLPSPPTTLPRLELVAKMGGFKVYADRMMPRNIVCIVGETTIDVEIVDDQS